MRPALQNRLLSNRAVAGKTVPEDQRTDAQTETRSW